MEQPPALCPALCLSIQDTPQILLLSSDQGYSSYSTGSTIQWVLFNSLQGLANTCSSHIKANYLWMGMSESNI